jgi:methionyl-tRNA formyltransferase
MATGADLRLVMMGTGTFAEPTFRALLDARRHVVGLVTQPDRPVGAQRGSTRQVGAGMAEIARQHDVPVYQPESVNTSEGVARLKEWRPDLLVVAAYGQILSHDVLASAEHGGINVHASLLQKYRGAAPVAWAIYHGETRTGVSIIRMSVHLDAGDVLAQEALDIGAAETAGELEARLAVLGARLANEVIDRVAAGTATGFKQDKALVTKAPKLTKEHGLIDWSKTAEQVCNQVRAMQPWPTAYTFLHRTDALPLRLIITKAAEFPVRYDPAVPAGTPFADPAFPKTFFVTAGEVVQGEERSVVEVYELQPAGKKRMAAADFLRGHPVRPGDHLGPEAP